MQRDDNKRHSYSLWPFLMLAGVVPAAAAAGAAAAVAVAPAAAVVVNTEAPNHVMTDSPVPLAKCATLHNAVDTALCAHTVFSAIMCACECVCGLCGIRALSLSLKCRKAFTCA